MNPFRWSHCGDFPLILRFTFEWKTMFKVYLKNRLRDNHYKTGKLCQYNFSKSLFRPPLKRYALKKCKLLS